MSTRRAFLGGLAGAGLVGTAGCLQTLGFQRESAWRDPILVDDRPHAVYVPAVTEGMGLYGRTTAGRYGVALTYSYPHRFWTLTGSETSKTVVEADDDVHLMASLWDTETGMALPIDSGLTIEIRDDEGTVTQEVAYPMLSQQMGMHYGDNYALSGEGEYEAHVSIGGVSVRRTGGFADAFESPETAVIPFEFDPGDVSAIEISEPETAGERDAIPPMEMGDVPVGRAPDVDSLPGRHLGRATVGDVVLESFVAADERGRFGASPYIYVSARTPHNGVVLPMMGLEATVTRDGETIFERQLASTLDPEIGYHYGAPGFDGELRAGDEVTLSVTTPPQIARHDGYETAFFELGEASVRVS
nr:iron transporter [Halobellus rufus]